MIHINSDPYNLKSPPACGSRDKGDVISMRVASHVVVGGESKLAKIELGDLCADCLEITGHLLIEINQSFREECREQEGQIAP